MESWGLPGACSEYAVVNDVQAFGCGPVGLTFIRFMSILGVHPINAFDMKDEKIKEVLDKGADYAFNSKKCDLKEEIRTICPEGIQFVLDAVGMLPQINPWNICVTAAF